jgi:ABC-type uncharacterized transport system involved in gliding motility auxiliary subunit
MTDQELQLINDYLVAGGSLVTMLEPSAVTQLDLADDSLNSYLLESWGIGARDDFVVDLGSSLYLVGLSFSYGAHPITERVSSFLTQYPSARSIEISEGADPVRTITQLVMTSERSWGETDFASIAEGSTIQYDEQTETSGPLALAAALEDSQSGARLVLIGDGDFASNGGFFAGGNGDLMVNSIDWAARQEDLIDITPRQRTVRQVLPATRATVTLLVVGTTVVIPGGIVLAGGWVWWNRRKLA